MRVALFSRTHAAAEGWWVGLAAWDFDLAIEC